MYSASQKIRDKKQSNPNIFENASQFPLAFISSLCIPHIPHMPKSKRSDPDIFKKRIIFISHMKSSNPVQNVCL